MPPSEPLQNLLWPRHDPISNDSHLVNSMNQAVDLHFQEGSRAQAIDIFRGLNVLAMIFVDNLGFVAGLPWWTYHMPADANGMTYVDMVFPAFLFLMGMSVPFSMGSRIAKGQTKPQLWMHVVMRSVSLVALGLFVSNAPQVDAQRTGMSSPTWAALGFVAIALVWIDFPGRVKHQAISGVLRFCGFALLISLAVIFRRANADVRAAWLDFSDWEILGLLGWAYLSVSVIYLLFERKVAVLASALGVLIAINALSAAGRLSWIASLPPYLRPFEAGLSSLTMAGLLVSLLLGSNEFAPTFRKKVWWGLIFAAILFAVGYLLRPLGISKIRDTPTWCLYCMSANTLIALLLCWIADIKGWTKWAGFAKPVGRNPLLSYFLPYVAYFSPGLFRLTADGTSGLHGVARSLLFTGLILVIVTLLNGAKIKLRL